MERKSLFTHGAFLTSAFVTLLLVRRRWLPRFEALYRRRRPGLALRLGRFHRATWRYSRYRRSVPSGYAELSAGIAHHRRHDWLASGLDIASDLSHGRDLRIRYLRCAWPAHAAGAKNEFAAAALVSIVLILGASITRQLSGNEIIENFFYAQLAGDFIMLVAFSLLTAWTPRSRFIWLLSAIAAVEVVETFYVQSAVRLALALVLFQVPLVWRSRDRNIKIQAAFVLLLPAVVPLHPSFMSMVRSSAHDGAISVSLHSMLLAVALLLAITLPAWIKQARSNQVDGDFALNCLGLGVALSAVVQIAAFFALGLGSPYAIKKHAFLVGTLLVTIAAVRTMRLTPLRGAVGRLNGSGLFSGPAAACAFATIAVALIFPWHYLNR